MENRAIQRHYYWTEPREPGVKGKELMGNVIGEVELDKTPRPFQPIDFVFNVWPLSGKLLCDDFQK